MGFLSVQPFSLIYFYVLKDCFMYKRVLFCLFMLMMVLSGVRLSGAGDEALRFYRIELHDEIDASTARLVEKSFDAAAGYDYIILDLNTYGGAVDAADRIRSVILDCGIPVVAFINNQAVSAGALISIACDSVYMKKGSTFGAASVVDGSGTLMPEKYQAFMKSMMRSTAEVNGRDPRIAEMMVMADSSGKVLSLTPAEAEEVSYCEGIAGSADEVASLVAAGKEYTLDSHEISAMERVIMFLMSPFMQAIFVLMIVGGLYFEIQSPGIGLPLAIAVLGALLYFSPLYVEGLAQNWEILLFVVGVGLIAMEIFVIPGFGVAGVTGILAVLVSLSFSMVDNGMFEHSRENGLDIDWYAVMKPFAFVTVSVFVAVVLSIYLAGKLFHRHSFRAISLQSSLDSKDGYVGTDRVEVRAGTVVVAETPMQPSGKVSSEGNWYEATMIYGYAEKGENLVVVKSENGRLYCRKA